MEKQEDYFKYTICEKILAARNRLRFIIDAIEDPRQLSLVGQASLVG
jgi:hypothetical protein